MRHQGWIWPKLGGGLIHGENEGFGSFISGNNRKKKMKRITNGWIKLSEGGRVLLMSNLFNPRRPKQKGGRRGMESRKFLYFFIKFFT